MATELNTSIQYLSSSSFVPIIMSRSIPPPAAKRLVRLSELRVACAGAGIGNVDVAKSRAVFCKVGSRDAALVRRLEGATPDAKIRELSRAISDYAKNLT